MGSIEIPQSTPPVGAHLPGRAPEPVHVPPQLHPWKRYLLPVLLVAMALIINVLAFFTPPKESAIPSQNEAVVDLTVQKKVDAAEALAQRADANFNEGNRMVNLMNWKDLWEQARNGYEEAWELITGVKYPAGFDDKYLIVESVQCRSLHRHLKSRLQKIHEKMD